MDWLTKIGPYTVEKNLINRPGNKPLYSMNPTGKGVLHTTEGTSIEGALSVLLAHRDPSHLLIGLDRVSAPRIIQLRPIGSQAAALHDPANRLAHCQIEIVGMSKEKPWTLDPKTEDMVVHTLAFMNKNYGIPLVVPMNWPDTITDVKPYASSNNSRRKTGAYDIADVHGWFMHMEVTNQAPTWHWDCGALNRSVLLSKAQALIVASVL